MGILTRKTDPDGTIMTQLQRYVDRFGSLAGPKLYHALQSRAAYIGASRRRGREIEGLTGKPLRRYHPPAPPAPEPEAATATVEPAATTPAGAPSLFA
jgi:hypothetical protein